MWHTSRGDRTLRGEEAALVRRAIDSMMDALLTHIDEEMEEPGAACESGVAVYDACSVPQRIGLLHEVAKYLLTETDSAIVLSAPLEATIAAIFVDIRDQVAIEIDFLSEQERNEDQPSWRQMVLAAYKDTLKPASGDNDIWEAICDELPGESSREIRRWELLIDALSDAILWDRDFEMAETFLDMDPGVSRGRRRLLGISEDYFTRIAPDPPPEQVRQLVMRTRDIVRSKPR